VSFESEINAGMVPEGMTREQWMSMSGIASNLPAVIAQNQTPGESWLDTAQKLMSGLVMADQQRRLMNINVERMRQGLPALDISQYSGVGVNVGLSQGTQQLVTYALVAGGLLLLLNTFLSRR